MAVLSKQEARRFEGRAVSCPLVPTRIESLSDYFSVFGRFLQAHGPFWYRGHADISWKLVPSALRFSSEAQRDRALEQVAEFKRVAEIKLPRPPRADDELGWHQVAQHFGLPTRLLDWTESALVALYFSCEELAKDGIVFVLNPIALNRISQASRPRILDARLDAAIIDKYLRLGGRESPRGRLTVAVNPIWNSERIMLQKGVFTLHGSRGLALAHDTPSLAAVPIPKEAKQRLRDELERAGVDEMTIFPELEHACRHLKRRAGLEMR